MSESNMTHPITRAKYTDLVGLNWSVLKHALSCPAKALDALTRERPSSERLILGSAIHCLTLEGEGAFGSQYAVMPKIDRRTKAGKANYENFMAKSRGKEVVKDSDMPIIRSVYEAVKGHPSYREVLGTGKAEAAIQWTEPNSGLQCKSLLDFVPLSSDPDKPIVDLKTTRDASPSGFCREIARFMYHGQAAFYSAGLAQVEDLPRRDVVLVAVEIEPPYCVGFYRLSKEAMESGERMFELAIDRWLAASATDDWKPHYTNGIEDLSIPSWALHSELADVSS